MMEIVAGVIVLILLLLGLALIKLSRKPPRVDLSRISQDAYKLMEYLYTAIHSNSPEKVYHALKEIDTRSGELSTALQYIEYLEKKIYGRILKLKQKYEKKFMEENVKPTLKLLEKYRKMKRVIGTLMAERRLMAPSWYAYFADKLPLSQAVEDSKDIIKHYQDERELEERVRRRAALLETA